MDTPVDWQASLGLPRLPVGIGFLDVVPPDVPAWSGGPVAAGCVFWKEAQQGAVFYTVPADHYHCAVGAHTHGFQLPAHRASELGRTLEFMVESKYLDLAEVPGIPALTAAPAIIAYGPLHLISFAPDVVLLAVNPAQAMLLYEAALKGGAGSSLLQALGRPACAVLPLACGSGHAAISLGCAGNRTYTGLPASEMYVCVPGAKWDAVASQLAVVLSANEAISTYNRQRQAQFADTA